MAELDVAPVQFKVRARPFARVGVAPSSAARVIIVPVPGGRGPTGAPGNNASIRNEAPAGDIDGTNTVFTFALDYQPGSVQLYLNGLRERYFTETGDNEITFDEAPQSGDLITADYLVA